MGATKGFQGPLPSELLIELLGFAFEPWGSGAFKAATPTIESVRRIEHELGIVLPPLLIQVAAACPSYGGHFGSIGDDYQNTWHMLGLNNQWRGWGFPDNYVIIDHGHDLEFTCWKRESASRGDDMPVVRILANMDGDLDVVSSVSPPTIVARTFGEYLDQFAKDQAPRCPVKNLRRRAKRLLGITKQP